MGFRFRRSVKVLPGVRLNAGKNGLSWTLGARGATVGVGPRGIRQNIGLPGTGISYSRRLDGGSRGAVVRAETNVDNTEERFGIRRTATRALVAVSSTVAVFCGLVGSVLFQDTASVMPVMLTLLLGGLVGLVLATVMPKHATRIRRELHARRKRFGERASAAMAAGKNVDRQAMEGVLALQQELELTDEEAGGHKVVGTVRGILDLMVFEEQALANGGKLPSVSGHEVDTAPDVCLFAAPAFMDKRGPNDETGRLFLTPARVIFRGTTLTAWPWSKIVVFDREDNRLVVQRGDRQTPLFFYLDTVSDAIRAQFIAQNIRGAVGPRPM